MTPDPRLPHHPSVDRRHFLLTSLAGALAGPLAADAQPAEKVYRVGLLSADTPRTQDLAQSAFVKTLRELGGVEGRNLLLEERLAMTTEQLDVLAAELVRLKVDALGLTIPRSLLARADQVIE